MTNLLVVEDDLKLNQIICSYLTDYGFTVKGCLNPNQAYIMLYEERYDLVISDIMTPFGEWEARQTFRQRTLYEQHQSQFSDP